MTGFRPLIAALFCAVALGPMAQAQDQNSNENNAEAPTTETPADVGVQGQASSTETIRSVHTDWEIRCRTEPDCFMYQLVDDARGKPIAEINVVGLAREDGAVAGFTVVSPLRTLLPEGVTLQVDNGRLQKYPFLFCAPAGCAARFGYTEEGIGQFKRGNVARMTIVSVDRPDAPVVLDVSLAGFTAAFDELKSIQP